MAIVQYERLLKKAEAGTLNTAELTFLVEKFDAAELYLYEQARELSIRLLKEWLVNFKFKEWTITETRGIQVTPRLRRQRAALIARTLNKSDHWHSHGRGISMEVLRRDLKLRIDDFGKDHTLRENIRLYDNLLRDYMRRLGHSAALHRRGTYVRLGER